MSDTTINADATQVGGTGNVMIDVTAMDKFFGDFHALKNINMKVGEQEVVVVIGPSGSGKSTLIRCINRLERHDRGAHRGRRRRAERRHQGNIQNIRRETGMVFQSFNLFPHLTGAGQHHAQPRETCATSPRPRPRPRPWNCSNG